MSDKRDRMQRFDVDISGAKILVVDDDKMNIKLAEMMLKDRFQVTSARSGIEAFEILKQDDFDLVLLDVHMPDMDGHEVIKQLKADDDLKEIPVIFLTADSDDLSEVQGFDEGALDYIRKPFRKAIALQRISRILELSYLQNSLSEEVEKQTARAIERGKKIERLSMQLVSSFLLARDAKDKYTNGHSHRVEKYTLMLAERMGIDEETKGQLSYAALLHDVGKIGIPDAIITKTSALNKEEELIVRNHPAIGNEILTTITELPNIALGDDGKGYPDGIAGEDIPLVARIISVADAYDAMASKRSYRDILPQDVIRNEIEKGVGTQFDPNIAKLMLDIIDEDKDYKLHE